MKISGKIIVETFDRGTINEREETIIILGWLKLKLRNSDILLSKFDGKIITVKGNFIGNDIFEVEEYEK